MKFNLRRYTTNPIVLRELVGTLRKFGAFVSLFLLASCCMIAVSIFWVENRGHRYQSGQTIIYYQDNLKEASRALFMGICYIILFLSSLNVILTTAAMISAERENRTFELLIVTGLTKTQIILGKLVSSLGFIFLLIISTLPVVSICFLMGGVDVDEVLTAYLVILTTIMAIGMIGIMFSSLCKSTKKAQGLAILFAVALYFFLPFGLEVFKEITGNRGFNRLNVFFLLNPFVNFFRLFVPNFAPPSANASGLASMSPLILTLEANAIVALFAFLFARPMQTKESENKYFDPEKGVQLEMRFKTTEIDTQYPNTPQNYPFKEKNVYFIHGIDVLVIGE